MRELPEETLYDIRLIDRHIKEGLITEEDVQKYMSQLSDAEEESDFLDVETLMNPGGEANYSGFSVGVFPLSFLLPSM